VKAASAINGLLLIGLYLGTLGFRELLAQSQESQSVIFQKLNEATLHFDQTNHFPEHPFSIDNAEKRVIDDPGYDYRKVQEYHVKAATIQFQQGTNNVIRFTNSDALNASGNTEYPTKQPPAWPENKAVAIARDWLKLFQISDSGILFDEGKARFIYQFGGIGPYAEGTWQVYFTRVSKKGIPFAADYQTVNVSETQGPFSMYVSRMSDFEEPTFNPISKMEALEKAKVALQDVQKSNIGAGWLGNAKPEGEPDAQLMIINPNNLTKQKDIQSAAAADQQKARLAWVVHYKMRDLTPVIAPNGTTVYHDAQNVQVFIDAENGNMLGGSL